MGGVNLYGFVGNNGVNFIDLLGRFVSANPQDAQTIADSFNDNYAAFLLGHWLGGSGETVTRNDGDWGDYMKRNELLKTQLKTKMLQDAANRTTTGGVSITFHAEIENNYYTGYGLLHGTNAHYGDFYISGQASKSGSQKPYWIEYKNIQYTWNDLIHPNSTYGRDVFISVAFGLVTNPMDYVIQINWHADSKVCVDNAGVHLSGYPFE